MVIFPFLLYPLSPSWRVMAICLLFNRIYRYQSHDYAFSSVEKLLHAVGGDDFLGLLNHTLHETLQKAGFSEKFINEMVAPIMKVNYGQSTDLSAFVGEPERVLSWTLSQKRTWLMIQWLLIRPEVGEGFLQVSDISSTVC